MARKRGGVVKKSQVESGSDTEYGIYNVECIVAKKTDPNVKLK